MNNFDIEKLRLNVELQTNFSLPIYTPRTSFNLIRENDEYLLNDLTLNFDPFTIKILKAEFENRNNELTKYEFIKILKDQMPNWQPNLPNRYNKLIRCLNILFGEIDINGNGTLEWEEFTNYIIDKANIINTLKQKNDVLDHYSKAENQIISSHIEIIKCIEIPSINCLAFIEQNSNEIKFANLDNYKILTGTLVVNDDIRSSIKENQRHIPQRMVLNSILIDIISFIHNDNLYLFVSSNNGIVRAYRYKNKFELDNTLIDYQIVYDTAQLVIIWDPISEILYSGEMNGIINMYDQKSEPQLKRFADSETKNQSNLRNKFKRINSIDHEEAPRGHSDSITVLLPIVKLQFLASASIDRKIILWDVLKHKKKKEFKNFHKKAITCLEYSEDLIILLSGSLDHQIYIWNPYVDSPIYSLKDHGYPILNIKLVKEPLHLLSLDNSGYVKLWDMKKLKCINTVNVKDKAYVPNNFLIISNKLRLVTVSKKLTIYNYASHNQQTDDETNVGQNCYFIEDGLIFATVKNNSVKLYNALTGDIKKIFNNLSEKDISSFIIDKFDKRFIIGDVTGACKVFNLFNGAFLKILKGHEGEIKFIFHSQKLERIITVCLDHTILVHDDSQLNEDKILRKINLTDYQIVYAELDVSEDFLLCLNSHNQVMKVDVLSGKKSIFYSELFTGDNEHFCILNDLNSIVILSNDNMVKLFSFSPLVLKTDVLLTIDIAKTMDANADNDIIKEINNCNTLMTIIQCIQTEEKSFFIMADNRGYIHKFECSELIAEIKKVMQLITSKKWVRDPKVNDSMIKHLWSVKIHAGNIRTMDINSNENIIITTCVENKVIISDLRDGRFIEILKNNMTEIKLMPVAYKKLGKDEIICAETKERIDDVYINFVKKIEELRMKQKMIHDREIQIKIEKEIKKLTNDFQNDVLINNVDDYDEFDPKYFIKNKFNSNRIKNFSSNKWALKLNIDLYHKQFEEKIYESKFNPNLINKTNNNLSDSNDVIDILSKKNLGISRRFTLDKQMIESTENNKNRNILESNKNNINTKAVKLPRIKMGKIMDKNQKSRHKEVQNSIFNNIGYKYKKTNHLDKKTKVLLQNLTSALEDAYKI